MKDCLPYGLFASCGRHVGWDALGLIQSGPARFATWHDAETVANALYRRDGTDARPVLLETSRARAYRGATADGAAIRAYAVSETEARAMMKRHLQHCGYPPRIINLESVTIADQVYDNAFYCGWHVEIIPHRDTKCITYWTPKTVR